MCVGWKSVSTLLSRAIHLGFGDRVPHQGARGVDQAQGICLTANLPLPAPGITMCHQSQLSLHGTGGGSKFLTLVLLSSSTYHFRDLKTNKQTHREEEIKRDVLPCVLAGFVCQRDTS